jgi:TIGR03009 family protein
MMALAALAGPFALGTTPAGARQAARTAAPAGSAPAPAAAAAPDPRKMEQILELWSQRSKSVKTLGVQFLREDVVQAWAETTRFEGTAYLQSPSRAFLKFDRIGEDGKAQLSEQIICTGERVYHFQAETKQVSIYPLAPEDKQKAMEEGPLPFLFNMDAANARTRYAMTLMKEDAANYLISITPIQKADQESFSRAFIFLDRKGLKPTKIVLVDPSNKKDTKTFTIRDIQENLTINAGWFNADGFVRKYVQAAKPEERWDVVMFDPQGNPTGGGTGARPAPAAAPAPASVTGAAGAARTPRR